MENRCATPLGSNVPYCRLCYKHLNPSGSGACIVLPFGLQTFEPFGVWHMYRIAIYVRNTRTPSGSFLSSFISSSLMASSKPKACHVYKIRNIQGNATPKGSYVSCFRLCYKHLNPSGSGTCSILPFVLEISDPFGIISADIISPLFIFINHQVSRRFAMFIKTHNIRGNATPNGVVCFLLSFVL